MRSKAFTKSEARELRTLAGRAYERELAAALEDLECEFTRWRQGEINGFDLSDAIHEFHNGQARTLWKLYNGIPEDLIVASAIARGTLREDDVPEHLRPKLPQVAV